MAAVDLGRGNPELEVELGVELRLVVFGVRRTLADVLLDLLAGHPRHRTDVAGELRLARVHPVEDAGLAMTPTLTVGPPRPGGPPQTPEQLAVQRSISRAI